MKTTKPKTDVYTIISERILAILETGANPWRKPWNTAAQLPPSNLISRRPYRGINILMLGFTQYESPYWLTFKQALDAGGHVRKGEKGSIAIFWTKESRKKGENGQTVVTEYEHPIIRYYNVFNSEQCEGIETPPLPQPKIYDNDPIAAADILVDEMPNKPTITHADRRRAFYRLESDTVNMPELRQFENPAEYYSTLFHELAHSTGHKSRLNRDMTGNYGSNSYGKEELIAEMAAAYICGLTGIIDNTIDNSAAYLDGWIRLIKEDKRAVTTAAAAAQRAVDYITDADAERAEAAA